MSLEIQSLVKAIESQTAMMGRLVESNNKAIELMTEVIAYLADDGMGLDDEPLRYMDGSLIAG